MNQLSYEVSNLRFKKQGFEFTGSAEQGIKETIRLLENAGRYHVKSNSKSIGVFATATLLLELLMNFFKAWSPESPNKLFGLIDSNRTTKTP